MSLKKTSGLTQAHRVTSDLGTDYTGVQATCYKTHIHSHVLKKREKKHVNAECSFIDRREDRNIK